LIASITSFPSVGSGPRRSLASPWGDAMTIASTPASRAMATTSIRWGYLAICIICIVMIANLQYGWTLFVIRSTRRMVGRSLRSSLRLFIALETWLTPRRVEVSSSATELPASIRSPNPQVLSGRACSSTASKRRRSPAVVARSMGEHSLSQSDVLLKRSTSSGTTFCDVAEKSAASWSRVASTCLKSRSNRAATDLQGLAR
jgi:hypothetical protein